MDVFNIIGTSASPTYNPDYSASKLHYHNDQNGTLICLSIPLTDGKRFLAELLPRLGSCLHPGSQNWVTDLQTRGKGLETGFFFFFFLVELLPSPGSCLHPGTQNWVTDLQMRGKGLEPWSLVAMSELWIGGIFIPSVCPKQDGIFNTCSASTKGKCSPHQSGEGRDKKTRAER